MDIAKYLAMVQTGALHLARADLMSDPWEGSVGGLNDAVRRLRYGEYFDMWMANRSQANETWRRMAFMSCWHVGEFESAAMWEIYQREGRGVAVQSTWGALTSNLQGEREIFGGRVKYVDYATSYLGDGNGFDAFMHKRLSFAHEREARLIALVPDIVTVGVAPSVVAVPVDISAMIENVYVAPGAPGWVFEVIAEATRRHGLDLPVVQSSLDQDPFV